MCYDCDGDGCNAEISEEDRRVYLKPSGDHDDLCIECQTQVPESRLYSPTSDGGAVLASAAVELEPELPDAPGDRDLVDELAETEAGYRGVPVEARCTGCKRVRAKLASKEDPDDGTAFRTVCHSSRCRGVTWWNVVNVLADAVVDPSLAGDQGGRSE